MSFSTFGSYHKEVIYILNSTFKLKLQEFPVLLQAPFDFQEPCLIVLPVVESLNRVGTEGEFPVSRDLATMKRLK